MNYEQFFYWLQGLIEFEGGDNTLSNRISLKMDQVADPQAVQSPLGKLPALPTLDTPKVSNEELNKMLDDFVDNFDNIPIEEGIPSVGSPIEDGAKEWEKPDKDDFVPTT